MILNLYLHKFFFTLLEQNLFSIKGGLPTMEVMCPCFDRTPADQCAPLVGEESFH